MNQDIYRDQNDVVKAFSDAVAILLVNRNEKHFLWDKYHTEHKWEDFRWGQGRTVGYVGKGEKRPVCISIGAFKLNGAVILTVEDTSRWVDHTMIEEWLIKNWPNLNTRDHHCNSGDFYSLLRLAAEANALREVV